MPRSKKLRVSVLLRSDRGTYYLQYRDPTTGRKVRRSTDATTKRAAEREAAKWEQELQQSVEDRRSGRMLWDEFRRLYEDEVLSSLAVGTDHKVACVFNVLERAIGPKRLCDLNEESLSRYQNGLRQNGRSESTIKGHLAHIKSSLSWAKNHKLISATPSVKMPERAKKSKVMKGRAITLEEFERILSKIEAVLFPPGVLLKEENCSLVVASWEYLLRGLWLSGLRLDESMQLHWTNRTLLCVEDLDKRQPMLWIPGSCQKSGQDAVLPMCVDSQRDRFPNRKPFVPQLRQSLQQRFAVGLERRELVHNLLPLAALCQQVVPPTFELSSLGGLTLCLLVLLDQAAELHLLLFMVGIQPATCGRHLVQGTDNLLFCFLQGAVDRRPALRKLLQRFLDDCPVRSVGDVLVLQPAGLLRETSGEPRQSFVQVMQDLSGVADDSPFSIAQRLQAVGLIDRRGVLPSGNGELLQLLFHTGERTQLFCQRCDPRLERHDLIGVRRQRRTHVVEPRFDFRDLLSLKIVEQRVAGMTEPANRVPPRGAAWVKGYKRHDLVQDARWPG